jgi:D-alanine-D-alanine ligase-like ATP-grasp enzyme
MSTKLRAAVMFGGKSAEHEISLISAMNIIAASLLDKADQRKYCAVAIQDDQDTGVQSDISSIISGGL